jgi:hypothetical protein
MAKHLMVDMETLAVTPDATILSIAAVHFDPNGSSYSDSLYFKVNLDDQHKLGRSIDPNTIEWWSKQNSIVMEEAFSENDRIPIGPALNRFHKFAWGCDAFWSHGATFDLVILENLCRQLNVNIPWQYWQLRDTRTLFDLGFDPQMPQNSKHDALQDAIRQVIGVQNVFRQLSNLRQ